jgi:dihydrofolate reductase
VAATEKRGIGKNGILPWKQLPIDMKFFKDTTSLASFNQNAVIMGRKTFEAIPLKFRPLVNRLNIVVTTNPLLKEDPEYQDERVIVSLSLDEALDKATELGVDQIFIIGGAQIYTIALQHDQCKKILWTTVREDFECDTFFPEISAEWKISNSSGVVIDNGIPIQFLTYERQ